MDLHNEMAKGPELLANTLRLRNMYGSFIICVIILIFHCIAFIRSFGGACYSSRKEGDTSCNCARKRVGALRICEEPSKLFNATYIAGPNHGLWNEKNSFSSLCLLFNHYSN